MRSAWTLLVLTTLVISFSVFAAEKSRKEIVENPGQQAPLALVYRGPGACFDGDCPKVAANLLRRAGYHTRYVRPSEITARLLSTAQVWVQPGGDALRVRAALSDQAFSDIKNFVYQGGSYLGFCAGAFLAGPWLDDNDSLPGLNIVPAYDFDHTHGDEHPRVEPILWNGQVRHVYYQGGAAFRVGDKDSNIVKATYQDGSAVILYSTYGKGKVAVSGAHPEAPNSWFQDDHLKKEEDTLDIALDMVSWISH